MNHRSKSSRRALLVGIDHYPHLPDARQLFGAVRDVESMADVLEGRFDFDEANLVLLRNADATRRQVLARLDELVEQTRPGDFLLLHWSGHGSQCPAPEGPLHVDEPDGLAETLVPHDARAPGDPEPGDVLDDEVRTRLGRLHRRGAWVTLIFDCCHSGHVYRTAGPRQRWVGTARRRPASPPLPSGVPLPEGPRPASRRRRRSMGRHQVVLAACSDHQTAGERLVTAEPGGPRLVHGHFTWSLLRELTADEPAATAGEVFRRARARMLAENARQTPQFAGADGRLLFGVEARAERPWVRVGSVHPDARPRPELDLEGGAAQQIEKGSLWQVHAPGTAQPSPRTRLGLAEIVDVGAFRSRARLVRAPRGPLEIDARAYLHRPARGETRMPVRLEVDLGGGALGDTDEAVGREIETSPHLRITTGDEADEVCVRRVPASPDGGGGLGVLSEDCWIVQDESSEVLAVVPVRRGVLALRNRLERTACHRRALRIENPEGRRRPEGVVLRLLDPPDVDPDDGLPLYRHGDAMRFEIVHRHRAPLYVYVLSCGLGDEVDQVFPLPGAEELLDPNRPLRVGVAEGDELDVFLAGDLSSPAAPDWRPEGGVEFLVLFATSEPTDLRVLSTERRETYRGAGTLQAWLSPAGSPRQRGGDDWWTVVRVPYRVRRR